MEDKELHDFFFRTDDLWKCRNLKFAEEWVKDRWNIATPIEQLTIAKTYLQVPSRQMRDIRKKLLRTQKGGTGLLDPRITKILAAADTYHDFKNAQGSEVEPELPKELVIDDLKNESRFLNVMTTYKKWTFGEEKIANPLYKACFFEMQFDKPIDTEEAYQKQFRSVQSRVGRDYHMVPVDVWSVMKPKDSRKVEVYRLEQVAQTVGVLRRMFGQGMDAVLDASGDQLVTIVVSLRNLNKFIYTTLSELSDGPLREKIAELMAEEGVVWQDWNIIENDATWYDAQTIKYSEPTIDSRPTGDVMPHNTSSYQISLQGLHEGKKGRYMELGLRDIDGTTWTLRPYRCDIKSITSKTKVNDIITNKRRNVIYPPPTSAKDLELVIPSLSIPLLYALKRTGNWGMVQSCVVHPNRVFFTVDRLAAMYAYYRGVPFVYFDDQLHSQKKDSVSVVQYTFTIVRPKIN